MRAFFSRQRHRRDPHEMDMALPELGSSVDSSDVQLEADQAQWASSVLGGVSDDEVAPVHRRHHESVAAATAAPAPAVAPAAAYAAASTAEEEPSPNAILNPAAVALQSEQDPMEFSPEALKELEAAAAAVFAEPSPESEQDAVVSERANSEQTSVPAEQTVAASVAESTAAVAVAEHAVTAADVADQAEAEADADVAQAPEQERESAAASVEMQDTAEQAESEKEAKSSAESRAEDSADGVTLHADTKPEGEPTAVSSDPSSDWNFSLEEVDSSSLQNQPRMSLSPLLEGEAKARYERQEELQAERDSARKQIFFVLSDENESEIFDASVHNTQLIQVRKPTLLDDDNEYGDAETEDFVTGNVTVLATGTDSARAVSAGGRGVAAEAGEAESESEEEPNVEELAFLPSKEQFRSTFSLGEDASLRPREPKLLPMLMDDLLHNWLVYSLAILACLLCLAKIYQVQETRELTASLNEITFNNADLDKEWLNLMATRQSLSEHAKIRTFASEQLQMQAPKIESEHVISLTPPTRR